MYETELNLNRLQKRKERKKESGILKEKKAMNNKTSLR